MNMVILFLTRFLLKCKYSACFIQRFIILKQNRRLNCQQKLTLQFNFLSTFYISTECKDFFVCGDFQGWATKVPKWKLTKKAGTVYTLTQDVKVGAHTYKYWSTQGTNGGWMIKDMQQYQNRIISPAFEGATSDGFGGKNAVLTVK